MGTVSIHKTDANYPSSEVTRTELGMPVRSLVWLPHSVERVVIGCVGGSLYLWHPKQSITKLVFQTKNYSTINVVRNFGHMVFVGTSDGFVHILDSETMK